MTRLLAIAELRLREGLAARLVWLVPAAFAVGVGAALWAQGPDPASRAALADRVVLWTAWGLAFTVAAVVPALGLPADIRTGAAETLFASPATRFEVVLGGTLGYGALSALLLAAMAGASVLGMQAAGLGAAEREPLRPSFAAEIADAPHGKRAVVDARTPAASFRFRVPGGLRPGEPLRVRFAPKRVYESRFETAGVAFVSAHRVGDEAPPGRQVAYNAGTAFTSQVPLGDLGAGEEAELTFRRVSGGWSLVFAPGSVEIGGARRLYALGLLTASLCAVPLLLVLASVGSLGAARFGAPTAVAFAAFLFVVLAGRNVIVDAAQYIVSAAADPAPAGGPEHDGHGHGAAAEITPARVLLAKAAIAVFGLLPRIDTFDRTGALVERRAPPLGDAGRAALEGLPAAAVLTAAGWLLLRRRELHPG